MITEMMIDGALDEHLHRARNVGDESS